MDVQKKIEDFFSQYKSHSYKKHETILFGNEEPQGTYYIAKGAVRSILAASDGRELTITLLNSQDIFPIIWTLYDTNPPRHTFQAIIDTEIRRAPRGEYLNFVKENPDVFEYNVRKVLRRLTSASDRLEIALLGNARERVASVLLFIAENLGKTEANMKLITVPLTHQEIADMVGISRETATIEMDKLQKEGFILYRGRELMVSGKLSQLLSFV